MAYWDNHEPRERPARFVAEIGQPQLCWPKDLFRGDSRPNTLSIDGHRHHVPAQRQPQWALAEVEAAAREGRPLVARKIGSAGKYSFWELLGGSLEGQRELAARFQTTAREAAEAAKAAEAAALAAELEADLRGRIEAAEKFAKAQGWVIVERIQGPEQRYSAPDFIAIAMDDGNETHKIVTATCRMRLPHRYEAWERNF